MAALSSILSGVRLSSSFRNWWSRLLPMVNLKSYTTNYDLAQADAIQAFIARCPHTRPIKVADVSQKPLVTDACSTRSILAESKSASNCMCKEDLMVHLDALKRVYLKTRIIFTTSLDFVSMTFDITSADVVRVVRWWHLVASVLFDVTDAAKSKDDRDRGKVIAHTHGEDSPQASLAAVAFLSTRKTVFDIEYCRAISGTRVREVHSESDSFCISCGRLAFDFMHVCGIDESLHHYCTTVQCFQRLPSRRLSTDLAQI